jgi:hypothetical protein
MTSIVRVRTFSAVATSGAVAAAERLAYQRPAVERVRRIHAHGCCCRRLFFFR